MKKLPLKTRILNYIRNFNGWINGGEIERLALSVGYKASNASRRCRELENEGSVQSEIRNGSVWYKAKEPVRIEKVFMVMPDGQRELFKTNKYY